VLGAAALAVNFEHLRAVLRDERTLVLLAWLLPPLAALAAGRNQLIRFVLPLLPVFALALAVGIFHLGQRWWVQATLALLVAVYPQRLFAAVSYVHHGDEAHAVRWGPLVLYAHD